jgi:hypothetical protein
MKWWDVETGTVEPAQQRWELGKCVPGGTWQYCLLWEGTCVRELGFSTWWDAGKSSSSFFLSGVFDRSISFIALHGN